MEWLPGESLATRIARGPLSLRDTADYAVQIADALEAAHDQGIVHRDLKPDNVFLVPVRGRRMVIKLLDFGIAKLVGNPLMTARKTRTGTFVGTPGYTSPEQARSNAVRPESDIYALGVSTYEMLTGQLPFDADNPFEIVHMHLYKPAPSAKTLRSDLPDLIDALVCRMMAKDLAERPTLAEVIEIMSAWRDELATARDRSQTPLGVALERPFTNTPPPTANVTPAPVAETPSPMASVTPEAIAQPIAKSGSQPIARVTMQRVSQQSLAKANSQRMASPPPMANADAPPTANAQPANAPSTANAQPTVNAQPASTSDPIVVTAKDPTRSSSSIAVEVLPLPPQQQRGHLVMIGVSCAIVGVVLAVVVMHLHAENVTPPVKSAVLVVSEPPRPLMMTTPVAPVVIAPLPAQLFVHANVAAAAMTLDGRPLTNAAMDKRIELDTEGEHQLMVSAPHRRPFTTTVVLRRGERVDVNARLERVAAPVADDAKGEAKNYVLDPFKH
jgi:serine/threonine-protein kinase